jgi:DNA-directed RNA polymerase subunit H (RpoH/RPB5)
MEPERSLFQIYKSEEEKIQIIIHHVLLMLSRRIYIDKDRKKQPLMVLTEDTQPEDKGDNTYTIKAKNGDKFAFKIVFQKIVTSGKQSALSEFIREYGSYKKIIIAKDYNNKIGDFALKHGIQIFRECTMLQDIILYWDQPIFELLSPDEMEDVKAEYNLTPYTINKTIAKTDITVKYFGLKKNNIYRVIRYSPTSGYAINYRIVS